MRQNLNKMSGRIICLYLFLAFSGCQPTSKEPKFLFPVCKYEKWGAIDETGNLVIPYKYDHMGFFHDGRAVIRQNGHSGIIDLKGNFIIPPILNDANPYREGLALVSFDDSSHFFIDTMGCIVFKEKENEELSPFCKNGLIQARKKDSTLMYYRRNGDIAFETKYKNGSDFSEGYVLLYSDSTFEYTGTSNAWPIYKSESAHAYTNGDFSEGLARIDTDKGVSFIDNDGHIALSISKERFLVASDFSEGLVEFSDNKTKLRGYLNKKGEVVIPAAFYLALEFSEGIAVVKDTLTQKYGFIDKTGKWAIAPTYDHIISGEFIRGLALVLINSKIAYINKRNTVIWISDDSCLRGGYDYW